MESILENLKRRANKKYKSLYWCVNLFIAVVAIYGIYSFMQNDISSYMFLKKEFVFFDFKKSSIRILVEYISMMILWGEVGRYLIKLIQKIKLLEIIRKD